VLIIPSICKCENCSKPNCTNINLFLIREQSLEAATQESAADLTAAVAQALTDAEESKAAALQRSEEEAADALWRQVQLHLNNINKPHGQSVTSQTVVNMSVVRSHFW
jgi:hypothetical protein